MITSSIPLLFLSLLKGFPYHNIYKDTQNPAPMARKVANRAERYRPLRKGRHRISRPKSFKTEESAKLWAESKGIKEFTLRNLRSPEAREKKLIVVKK